MATIGLSKPYFATYSNSGTTVTYSDGALLGKAITMSISVDDADDNILYADNGAAESAKSFTGGTVTIGTDEISPATMVKILGVSEETISGSTVTGAKWYVNDDDQTIPYLGVGGIIKKRINGADKYQAVALDKVQFGNLSNEINTQGESIEWQTPEISGTIMRSDNTKHSWRRLSSLCDSEADAETLLKGFFSIT